MREVWHDWRRWGSNLLVTLSDRRPELSGSLQTLAALLDVVPNEWNDLKFLEQVAQAGVRVTLGEGEKKVQDIRIAGGS